MKTIEASVPGALVARKGAWELDQRPVVLASPGVEPSGSLVAVSLAAHGLLRRWLTPFAVRHESERGFLASLSLRCSKRLRQLLSARTLPPALGELVDLYPTREIVRILAHRLGVSARIQHRLWLWAAGGFDRYVARKWAGRAPCLYGFEQTGPEAFRRQKAAGGYNVLWQVIAHHRFLHRLLREELERHPDLMTPYQQLLIETTEAAEARKDEQDSLADLIICNSDFVRRSFLAEGFAESRLAAVPSPFPPLVSPTPPRPTGKVVFLHAGTLSVRKGTHVLLRAWNALATRDSAELWLVGNNELPDHAVRGLPASVVVRPRVPRSEMGRLFAQSSVLVLPTLGEGRANVILMAMSHGVPVISTPNSGCEDAVRDSETGWVVPIRDADSLAQKMAWCLEHTGRLRDMGLAATQRAAAWQLAEFTKAHGEVIRDFLARRDIGCDLPPHATQERMMAR